MEKFLILDRKDHVLLVDANDMLLNEVIRCRVNEVQKKMSDRNVLSYVSKYLEGKEDE